MRVILEKDKPLIFYGPIRAEILEGSIEAFGAILKKGEKVNVEEYFAVPINAVEDSELDIDFGEGSSISQPLEDPIPKSWREAVDKISKIDKKPLRIMVIGDVDTGKTGFITFLVNKLFQMGLKVFVLDTDTGQSEIGPPTTIGLGIIDKPIFRLSKAKFIDGFFVGSTTPADVLDRMITGSIRLLRKAENLGADIVAINTTGWVYDKNGRELKISKILAIDPYIIVFTEEEEKEMNHLKRAFDKLKIKIISVKKPKYLRERSRESRKLIRENKYKLEFQNAKEVEISLDDVSILYGFLGSGEPLDEEVMREIEGIIRGKILYAEKTGNTLLIVTRKKIGREEKIDLRHALSVRDVIVIDPDHLKKLLIGLYDDNLKFLGLGIIIDYDFSKRVLKVFTRAGDEITAIAFGHIRLDIDGREIEYIYPWSC